MHSGGRGRRREGWERTGPFRASWEVKFVYLMKIRTRLLSAPSDDGFVWRRHVTSCWRQAIKEVRKKPGETSFSHSPPLAGAPPLYSADALIWSGHTLLGNSACRDYCFCFFFSPSVRTLNPSSSLAGEMEKKTDTAGGKNTI